MTFGTCQVRDAWLVFAPMETEIRKDSYRRSQVLISLKLASLVGLFGLGYFLAHHPTQYAMPVFLAYMAALVCGSSSNQIAGRCSSICEATTASWSMSLIVDTHSGR
jgi:hypothetical protein